MTSVETREPVHAEPPRLGQAFAVIAGLALIIVATWIVGGVPDSSALQTWAAMFVAIVVQSLPFLLLGVLLSALVATFLTERAIRRVLPRSPVLAVPTASVAGIGLVGCECASVPLAGSVIRKGIEPAVALAFLLAAPAVNPVVIVSTVVAFPGLPEMAFARFLGSFLISAIVGWVWLRWGRGVSLGRAIAEVEHRHRNGVRGFVDSVHHDLISTAGYLVLGAMMAAAVNTFIPRSILEGVGSHVVWGVLVLAVFAFVVALCSQTDAFVAASLSSFSPTAQLVFLVVGPAMDVKLASLEAGYFGRRFAQRFVPLVLGVAVLVGSVLGWVLL